MAKTLAERLDAHPVLKERFSRLLDVVENAAGDTTLADAAEQRVVEELRQMGNEALHVWGAIQASKANEELISTNKRIKKDVKKN